MPCCCPSHLRSPRSFPELIGRCTASSSIAPFLEPIAGNSKTWMAVLRCNVCGQTWACDHPFLSIMAVDRLVTNKSRSTILKHGLPQPFP
jgi:hypothetical protein